MASPPAVTRSVLPSIETTQDFAPRLPPRPDHSMHVRRSPTQNVGRVEGTPDTTPTTATLSVGPSSEAVLAPNASDLLGDRHVAPTEESTSAPVLGAVSAAGAASNEARSVIDDGSQQHAEASTVGPAGLVLPPGAAPAASGTNVNEADKEILAVGLVDREKHA